MSFHWLKVSEPIKYILLSITYQLLTTSQHTYLSDLISVQPLTLLILQLLSRHT